MPDKASKPLTALATGLQVAMDATVWVETVPDKDKAGKTHWRLSAWNCQRIHDKVNQLMAEVEDHPGTAYATFSTPRIDEKGKWYSVGFVYKEPKP